MWLFAVGEPRGHQPLWDRRVDFTSSVPPCLPHLQRRDLSLLASDLRAGLGTRSRGRPMMNAIRGDSEQQRRGELVTVS